MALKVLGRTGAVAGKDVVVSDLLRIGAGADSDFRIVVGGVSRNHARIVRKDDAYFLEDAGSTNGTFLNGQRVARERLRHLDVVTLGRDVDLIVVNSDRVEAPAGKAVISDAWLTPMDAAGGARVDVPAGELTMGRLAPSNFIVESAVVSKIHARIQRSADQVIVQDLSSVNGTFVNGQRISAPTLLKDGDTLSIAGIRNFSVHVTGEGRGQQAVAASSSAVFDQEWKTKLVWSAEELAQLETERAKILAAAQRAQEAPAAAAEPAKKPLLRKTDAKDAGAAPPVSPAAAKPAVAPPKPAPAAAAPVAPKAAPPAPPVKADAAPKPPAPAPPAAAVAPKPAPPAPPAKADVPAAVPPAAAKPPAPAAAAAPPKENIAAPKPPAPPAVPVAPKVAPPKLEPAAGDAPTKPTPIPQESVPTIVTPVARPLTGVRLAGPLGTFTLAKGEHKVGRLETANVPVLDLNVSRNHAVIVVGDTTATVEDTKSANGTYVNGTRLKEHAPITLKVGDKLKFGSAEFNVELMS
jgi:pSer/pThr/pTyr-binding forkhead associated (FHA) protein